MNQEIIHLLIETWDSACGWELVKNGKYRGLSADRDYRKVTCWNCKRTKVYKEKKKQKKVS